MYKRKADEMKEIALIDMSRLESKLKPIMHTYDETGSINSDQLSGSPTRRGNSYTLQCPRST